MDKKKKELLDKIKNAFIETTDISKEGAASLIDQAQHLKHDELEIMFHYAFGPYEEYLKADMAKILGSLSSLRSRAVSLN